MTRHKEGGRSHCPVSFALDVLGDRWTLLVVRDMLLFGKRTYSQFLASEEGIATNVLADRLGWLVRQGIVTKRGRGYQMTGKGRDLLPVLLELVKWSAKYDPHTAAPAPFVRRATADPAGLMRDILFVLDGTRP
jgi:DNA-binding HxlR family transcriptional regulator